MGAVTSLKTGGEVLGRAATWSNTTTSLKTSAAPKPGTTPATSSTPPQKHEADKVDKLEARKAKFSREWDKTANSLMGGAGTAGAPIVPTGAKKKDGEQEQDQQPQGAENTGESKAETVVPAAAAPVGRQPQAKGLSGPGGMGR